MRYWGIDFGTVAELLTGLGNLILSFTAIYALNAWKKEAVGRRKLELAEQLLSNVYEATDNLFMLNSRILAYCELLESFSEMDLPDDVRLPMRQAARTELIREIDSKSEYFTNLKARRFVARASFSWGGDFLFNDIDDIHKAMRSLFPSVSGTLFPDRVSTQAAQEVFTEIRDIVLRAESLFSEYVSKR